MLLKKCYFTAKYEMEGNTAGDCDYQLLEAKSSSPAYLYSPRYPSSYPKNVRCTYTISARYAFFLFYVILY